MSSTIKTEGWSYHPLEASEITLNEASLSPEYEASHSTITLRDIREEYLWEFQSGNYDISSFLKRLSDFYVQWVRQSTYLIYGIANLSEHTIKHIAVKCSKRGNDVYARRVRERFSLIYEALENNKTIRSARESLNPTKTNYLFLTLTCDRSRSLYDAWMRISKEWNLFCSKLRQHYGKISFIRTWESQHDGYPHIHALIMFPNHQFPIILHTNKEGVESYRLDSYSLKEKIASMWRLGFVDIIAFPDVHEGVNYLGKYITKASNVSLELPLENPLNPLDDIPLSKSLLTLAITWFLRKRSFSISRDFNDLISGLHNSNTEKASLDGLEGNLEPLEKIYFIGIVVILPQKGIPPLFS